VCGFNDFKYGQLSIHRILPEKYNAELPPTNSDKEFL
jgi:hypothetical protein